MKKLMVFLMLFMTASILMSCATSPSIPAGLLGEWHKIDGDLILTFEKKKFNLVDYERGYAGYGTYKVNGSGFRFEYTSVLLLNRSTAVRGNNSFQKNALDEYHKKHPQVLQALNAQLASEGVRSITNEVTGTSFNEFLLDENLLIIERYQPESSFSAIWVRFLGDFNGQFRRIL